MSIKGAVPLEILDFSSITDILVQVHGWSSFDYSALAVTLLCRLGMMNTAA
jgi:hypothetical protein